MGKQRVLSDWEPKGTEIGQRPKGTEID